MWLDSRARQGGLCFIGLHGSERLLSTTTLLQACLIASKLTHKQVYIRSKRKRNKSGSPCNHVTIDTFG